MTRIALLPSAYVPTLGGVQELTRHLALALHAAGDDVEVWWQQDDAVPGATKEVLDGLVVRRFAFPLPRRDARSVAALPAVGAATLRAMRRATREFRPDVLHVQCFGPNGLYATALSMLTRTPLVVTLQGETVMDDQDVYEHSATLRTALRLGLRRATWVTGCSQFTLDDSVRRFGLRPARSSVVFNGVGTDQVPAAELPAGLTGRYVLALGRVVEKKGFDLLLRGFAPIAASFPDVDVVVGGDGAALNHLRELAAELGIAARVRFVGRLARHEVAAAMNAAEVFVMPSRLEPFGIVLLEAWRAGRPVISTLRGGPPEFVEEGKTGLLVDPFDIAAMTEALSRLLGDEALRTRMSVAAQQRVHDFAWPRIAEQYRNGYRAAISGAPAGRTESR